MKWEVCKEHLCILKYSMIVWIVSWTAWFFFHGTSFLLERMSYRLCLLSLGCLVDIFWKINDVSLSLQEKQLTVFVANDKMWTFKQKFEFLKYHTIICDSVPILKDFTDETGDINECDYCIMKCINIWNTSHNSVI